MQDRRQPASRRGQWEASLHGQALHQANEVRMARARRKRAVGALKTLEGLREVQRLVRDPPAEIRTLPAIELLQWPRRWGYERARKMWRGVAKVPWPEARTIEMLTDHQRNHLVAAIESVICKAEREAQDGGEGDRGQAA